MYSKIQGRGAIGENGLWTSSPFLSNRPLRRLDVADILRADDVERAGLRGEDRASHRVRPAPAAGCRGGSRAPISFLLVSDTSA